MVRDSRKIAAILAADVVDYSRLMGADEAGTLAALAIRREIFDTLVREFDGRVFGSVGDSLMAEFASAVNAVECAKHVQDAIASVNAAVAAGAQMRLRIGVNLGDVIEGADGIAGDAVNVAARLQALAKPGSVLISGAVYDQVHLKVPARYVDAGTRRVKNIEEPVRTFEVLPAPQDAAARMRAAFAHFTARRPAANRRDRRGVPRGCGHRAFLARHSGAGDRPYARRGRAARTRRAARIDRGAAVRQHDRRPDDRLPRRRARGGTDPSPRRDTGTARRRAPRGILVQGQGFAGRRDSGRPRRRLGRRRQRAPAGRRRAHQRGARRPRDRRQSLVEFVRLIRRLLRHRARHRHSGADGASSRC